MDLDLPAVVAAASLAGNGALTLVFLRTRRRSAKAEAIGDEVTTAGKAEEIMVRWMAAADVRLATAEKRLDSCESDRLALHQQNTGQQLQMGELQRQLDGFKREARSRGWTDQDGWAGVKTLVVLASVLARLLIAPLIL